MSKANRTYFKTGYDTRSVSDVLHTLASAENRTNERVKKFALTHPV